MNTQTIAQQLKVKDFPFVIKNKFGHEIYLEDSHNYWEKTEYNEQGNFTYYEDSKGYWEKREYNDRQLVVYEIDSTGFWAKKEWNEQGDMIYFESEGNIVKDMRPKLELTLEQKVEHLTEQVDMLLRAMYTRVDN